MEMGASGPNQASQNVSLTSYTIRSISKALTDNKQVHIFRCVFPIKSTADEVQRAEGENAAPLLSLCNPDLHLLIQVPLLKNRSVRTKKISLLISISGQKLVTRCLLPPHNIIMYVLTLLDGSTKPLKNQNVKFHF